MSKKQHTPGRIDSCCGTLFVPGIDEADADVLVARIAEGSGGDIRRLRDCWNACEGIDNPTGLRKQRDDLLEAAEPLLDRLQQMYQLRRAPRKSDYELIRALEDAIKKARVEQ